MLKTRALGPYNVSAVGLGCMHLSFPSDRHPGLTYDLDRGIAVIHAALDAGVTLLDTADIYAPSWNTMGHNERCIPPMALDLFHDRYRYLASGSPSSHSYSGTKVH